MVGLSVIKPKQTGNRFVLGREFERERGLPEFRSARFFSARLLREGVLVSPRLVLAHAARRFAPLRIGEHQFVVIVSNRTGSTFRPLMNVAFLEAAHDLHMASTSRMCVRHLLPGLALRRAFTRPAMSTNSIAAGMHDIRLRILLQFVKSRVRHGDDANIRINGAKGIIRRLRLARR